jgi:hypothetical protein
MQHQLTEAQWVAIAAHRLQHRWRSINPGQLDDLAAELWRDTALRALEPAAAVDTWLAPVWGPEGAAVAAGAARLESPSARR